MDWEDCNYYIAINEDTVGEHFETVLKYLSNKELIEKLVKFVNDEKLTIDPVTSNNIYVSFLTFMLSSHY